MLAAAACLGLAAAPRADARPPVFMSCGSYPDSITYRAHPRSCHYSVDGTELMRINLEGLRWRGWGKARAVARGYQVDNHDQDNNGFQRHRVRIVVSSPVSLGWQNGRRYYRWITVTQAGEPTLRIPLRVPYFEN